MRIKIVSTPESEFSRHVNGVNNNDDEKVENKGIHRVIMRKSRMRA